MTTHGMGLSSEMSSSLVQFADAATSGEVRQAFDQIVGRWNEAASKWSPDGFAALYTTDAVFFGGRPTLHVGSGQIREYFASYQRMVAAATLTLLDQHVIRPAPHLFLAQGFGEFRVKLVSGGQSESTQRTTLLVARDGLDWKIAQHHFSPVPPA